MNKFIISTPGRTASSSLFNYIEESLKASSDNTISIDRGQYTSEEWKLFNSSSHAAFTTFNPFHMPNLLNTIDPEEWCLIVLSRDDFSSWLLSINSLNTTNKWHPGKEHVEANLIFEQDTFMSSYWYYKCWQRLIKDRADNFNFGKVVRLDFNNLTTNWSEAGNTINGWDWEVKPSLMKMGMSISWKSIANINEVLTWIPDDVIINEIKAHYDK